MAGRQTLNIILGKKSTVYFFSEVVVFCLLKALLYTRIKGFTNDKCLQETVTDIVRLFVLYLLEASQV